jgi:hypothetical protein
LGNRTSSVAKGLIAPDKIRKKENHMIARPNSKCIEVRYISLFAKVNLKIEKLSDSQMAIRGIKLVWHLFFHSAYLSF